MLQNIAAVGADRTVRGSKIAGSVIVEGMTVGGA
jgi:predicted Zn-dependent protease